MLKELTWSNVYTRPDLQIVGIILKMQDNYKYYKGKGSDFDEEYAFADAAYNGGIGGLDRERRICNLTKGCDPTKWFGHVENYCLKSKTALYGQRSACDINRHHVKDVMIIRAPKYKKVFTGQK